MKTGWEIRCSGIRAYFSELEELSGDVGGRAVMEKHREKCLCVETREEELREYRLGGRILFDPA